MRHFFKILSLFLLCPAFFFAQGFYAPFTLQKIELKFAQANWDYILDTAKLNKDAYVKADWVKINGTELKNVGVKYKGNSSYDSTFAKNPLHIELNTWLDQSYEGFVDIKLGNSYADPSMEREVLSYYLLKNYMDCSASNFAQVYVNGTYLGLYSNSESVNKQFCRNHFFGDKGTFVKCNPLLTPSPNVKSNLKYISPGDSSAYFNYYEMKSDYGWKNLAALCDSVSNNTSQLENTIDVDRVLWMLAFNNLFVNLDSYTGAFAQNYYLYKDHNARFAPIIWDLNMSFGGFPFLGNTNSSLASLSITNMQNLAINAHANDPYWPLIKAVYAQATLKRKYTAHLKTMLEEVFSNNLYVTEYQKFKNVIDTAVLSDTKKFYSYVQFQNALNTNYSVGTYSVPGIQTLMAARVTYLQGTTDLTSSTPTIVATGAVNQPSLGAPITLTAQVTNANSNGVSLNYKFTSADLFHSVSLFDDGLHGDGAANDLVFGANLTFTNNQMYYYIYAENNNAGIFSPQRAEHEFHSLQILPKPQVGDVVINEFLADNSSDVRNEFNMHADWIEIYNTSNSNLSLSDFYVSNENNERTKFAFPPNASLQPHHFLVVWADKVLQQGSQLHAFFKLSKNGDQIILSDGKNYILDSLRFGEQFADQSIGLCPDGLGDFINLPYPSYAMANCVVGMDELDQDFQNFGLFPNPAKDQFFVDANSNEEQSVIVYNQLGQMLLIQTFKNKLELSTNNWPNGVYFVRCNQVSKKLIIHKD